MGSKRLQALEGESERLARALSRRMVIDCIDMRTVQEGAGGFVVKTVLDLDTIVN